MKNIRLFPALALVTALTVSSVPAGAPAESGTEDAPAYLGRELAASAERLIRTGEDMDDVYTEISWKSVADTFPEKFDLRKRGTVTPVRNQTPWSTCWSFADIAASETSILNSLGMTAEQYREKFGEDLDLSEKHLAWFTASPLPEVSEYAEGGYPYNPSQAGEGLHPMEGTDTHPMNFGGNNILALTTLANGSGVVAEKYASYSSSEGTTDSEGDWSLPELMRYAVSIELKDANLLPAPAAADGEGGYVYRAAGTEAIKSELLAGRAVAVSIRADKFAPGQEPVKTPEEKRAEMLAYLKGLAGATEAEKARFADIWSASVPMSAVPDDELRDMIRVRARLFGIPEDCYDLDLYSRDQLRRILKSAGFGGPIEDVLAEKNQDSYAVQVGSDPLIVAQYAYEPVQSNHLVTVVGWDDTFAAENWPEDRRPPADGVWIAKNSWGPEWGDAGYFMISYYDMSLSGICTFEYVVKENSLDLDTLAILAYDNMPAETVSSTLFPSPVWAANVFTMEADSVLQYVSAMTGDLDTTVTASVYLLNGDAALPSEGILLDSVTDTFRYAGYHRLSLNGGLLLPAGARIGIVILETVPVDGGVKYALVNTASLNLKGAEEHNAGAGKYGPQVSRYAKGIVNPGESFVSFEPGTWTDWADAIAAFGNTGSNAAVAYDNLPIKACIYPLAEVERVHDLSERIPTSGGEAAICPEDGYLLLDTAK